MFQKQKVYLLNSILLNKIVITKIILSFNPALTDLAVPAVSP